MIIQEEVKKHLKKIKSVIGVENAVLVQRDGHPIQSAGIWLSKDEIFNLSSATSAIYNLGLHLHPDSLKHILIEGKSAKILLAPLKNSLDDPIDRIMLKQGIQNNNEEYFIAITASPKVNLGGILLKTRDSLRDIKRSLVLSGESFKPPLRKFTSDELKNLLQTFQTKEDINELQYINTKSFSFSDELIRKINIVFRKMGMKIIDLDHSFLTTSGGFIVSHYQKKNHLSELDFEQEAAMTYSLYSTSNRCAWLLKKMKVDSILLECDTYFQFISKVVDGIFSMVVNKGSQKLGLLRLIIPQYLKLMENLIKDARIIREPIKEFNLKSIIGELLSK
ncbi:MAG: roadblock/LC7 domain-containing protein [Promethearchaeota archaeon]